MSDVYIYILTRPLGQERKWLSKLGSGVKHWALIVRFPYIPEVYLCEITSDGNVGFSAAIGYTSRSASGRAIRRCVPFHSLKDCEENQPGVEIKYLGRCTNVKVDINLLNILTKTIDIDEYNVVFSNCQTFVKKFINLLNVRDNNGKPAALPSCSLDLVRYAAAGATGIIAIAGSTGAMIVSILGGSAIIMTNKLRSVSS